jgi:hypothetical protein
MRWEKEGGSLPARASQVRNVLRIERVREEDSGKYICTSQGRMQYVNLMVERMTTNLFKTEIISIQQSAQSPGVGDSLDVTCEVSGVNTRDQTIKWTKVGHFDLGEKVVSRGGMMRFEELTKENEGVYRCTVTTPTGTPYKMFNLSVQGSA